MHRYVWLIATAAVAVAGCGAITPAPGGEPKPLTDVPCTNPRDGYCIIKIGGGNGSSCQFNFDNVPTNTHRLKLPSQPNLEIRWQLVGNAAAGYEFQAAGDFVLKHDASSGQFSGAGLFNLDPKAFRVADANNDGQQYEYGLLLHSTTGGDNCPIDPYINNN